MINPAILCVPAMVASNVARRQREAQHHECFGPLSDKVDREARKRYVERYVEELQEAGFEVRTCHDVIDDRTIIDVRRGNVAYRTSVDNVYFTNDLSLTYEIRELVRKVENAIAKKEKENPHVND